MVLQTLPGEFTVAKLTSTDGVDTTKPHTFLSVTDDEISLVCRTDRLPANTTEVEHGWRALKISGILDFGMIGVIAGIAGVLAEHKISVFVISTYNTDYILVKADRLQEAVDALKAQGYEIP